MLYDQAVAVAKMSMRAGFAVTITPDEEGGGFVVAVVTKGLVLTTGDYAEAVCAVPLRGNR